MSLARQELDREGGRSSRGGGLTRGRVLVVDRDPAFSKGAVDLLRREGYLAHTLTAPAALVRRSRRIAPELVLLGPDFPSGLERHAIARLRRATRTAGVPVFRIADGRDHAELSAAFAAGLDDCILRPFFPDELFGRMDRALERYRSLRGLLSPAGLPTGEAAYRALDRAAARFIARGGSPFGLILYLPGLAGLLRSDRAAHASLYRALWRELPHRCADLLVATGLRQTGLSSGEIGPGVVLLLGALHPFALNAEAQARMFARLSRLLFASDRWLDVRGAQGVYLAADQGGQLRGRAMPRPHALSVMGPGWERGTRAVLETLELELERDNSGRAGGRLRTLRV